MSESDLKIKLRQLRHHLHSQPELSGKEQNTIEYLSEWASANLNGWQTSSIANDKSLLLSKRFGTQGISLLFRAELDALPITEINNFSHRSKINGISHKCGHDGHMAILMGLAMSLNQDVSFKGTIYLLFQHAEETGEGGAEVLRYFTDKNFRFDAVFALHNVPGFEKGSIVCKSGHFSMASTGLIFEFEGQTAHAAEPEKANSPLPILQKLLPAFQYVDAKVSDKTKISTIVGINYGGLNFGISPANMTVYLTLRATTNDLLDEMIDELNEKIHLVKESEHLDFNSQAIESFPACFNNKEMYELVHSVANSLDLHIVELESAFRWSEDFGHILNKFPGCIFGIGAGLDSKPLHHPEYDFPDEITMISINVFSEIIRQFEK